MVKGGSKDYAGWDAECGHRGGRLAAINSAFEQKMAANALKGVTQRAVLTGMKREHPHGHFVNRDGVKLPYS